MKFSNLFSRLPHALLLCSLSLFVAAAPASADTAVELTVLTPENFKQTISEGVWFIEHFSPYCGHCRKFLPTWEQLVQENEKQDDSGIHLAQVNCAVDGDLCRENNVNGYPQMNLYKNGVYVETFTDPRDVDILREYLSKHAEPKKVPARQVVGHTSDLETPLGGSDNEHNPTGTVMVLNDKNFKQTIQEGHVFVKFYAPWCGHCKKLAPVWIQLAQEMRGKLNIAEIDCESNAAICRSEGVTGFPMLFYYGQRGHGKTEYTSNRKLESLKVFSEKISGPAVQSITYEQFDTEVAKHAALFLFLHPEGDTASLHRVLQASRALFGTPPVYASTSSSFYERFNLNPASSVVLSLKDFDRAVPAGIYHLGDNVALKKEVEDLSSWLVRNRLPMSMQLDSDTFQDIMFAPHKPLVVITAAPQLKLVGAADRVRTVAQHWKDRQGSDDVVFTWMDSDKWASWLKSMYGIKADNQAHVVVTNHSRLVYYDTDQLGERIKLSPESVISALNGALASTISYKNSENIVERMARYINNKLVFIEHVVSFHPWAVSVFVVGVLAALALFLRRLWSQETALADELARKARRD